MFKNYFKTSLRNLFRHKRYTFISIAGLGIGIAVCLVIFMVIRFELSYDRFHNNKDRIYRVLTTYQSPIGGASYTSGVPFPLPRALANDFPQITSAGIVSYRDMQIMVLDEKGNRDKKFNEKKGVFFVETSFFKIFDFPWISGKPEDALKEPNSAVLTKETAEKYFGNWHDAVGKLIRIDNIGLLKITGILENVPLNSDFQFRVVIPYTKSGIGQSTDWRSTFDIHQCYVLMPAGLNVVTFNKQLAAFSKKYRSADNLDGQVLQPLREIHYDKVAANYSGKIITAERIRIMWLIAGIILLIACVNFINLATSQSVNRAKEIGIRKVMGSNKRQLKTQFMVETLLIVAGGLLLSVIMALCALNYISNILEVPLTYAMLFTPGVLIFLVAVTIITTLLAGFYPSLVLSGFNPVAALKSKFLAKSTKGISLRRGLVVFQFVIAQALIIGTLIIVKQMNYFENVPLGFNKEAIVNVAVPNDSASLSKLGYLRNQLLTISGIKQVSFSSTTPAHDNDNWTSFKFDHSPKETDFFAIDRFVDAHYLDTYQLPLVAGRNFTSSDSVIEFLVNEAVVKKLGFKRPEEILHKEINLWDGFTVGEVVGVVKDFHASSLKDTLAPVIMANEKAPFHTAGIKLTSAEGFKSMKRIADLWTEVFPDFVFEYQFLDDKIDSFYKKEKQLSRLFQLFAVIAILLSCLGLYGLTSFMTIQRLKEVGIRRVLGASHGSIVYLFSREFLVLIGISFLLALPLAWYFMHQWLQNYVYRIDMGIWVFFIGGLMSLLVALATISFQAIKATLTNPVKSLRSE
jgi:putative ABC transport system permease protein